MINKLIKSFSTIKQFQVIASALLTATIGLTSGCAVEVNPEEKYALLVRGDAEQRHVANISIAYQTLIESGYKASNIYILAEGQQQQFYHPVNGSATYSNIEAVLANFDKVADANDSILVFLNGHGLKVDNSGAAHSEFVLQGKDLSAAELKAMTQNITSSKKLFVFDFCYDGEFAQTLSSKKSVTVSASVADQKSYALENDSFSGFFFQAFRSSSRADENWDGVVSVSEAYEYAKANNIHSQKQLNKPMLVSAYVDPARFSLSPSSLDSYGVSRL